MKKAILALLALAFSANSTTLGVAKDYANDANIQSNGSVIFASGFENGFQGWSSYNSNISKIVSDAQIAFTGNSCLRSTATKDQNTGGDVDYPISPAQEKVYLRFYTKFPTNMVTPHHFVKIRAVKSGSSTSAGSKPAGDEAFWTGIEPKGDNTWHFYTYWHEMHSWQSLDGTPTGAANPYYGNEFWMPYQTPFEEEQWVCVEAMLKANTPNQYDGEQAFWINGELVGHWKTGNPMGQWKNQRFTTITRTPVPFEGFNWRTASDVLINRIKLQWYVTTQYEAGQTQAVVYWDNVVLATEYIGPMCDAKGDPVLDPTVAASRPTQSLRILATQPVFQNPYRASSPIAYRIEKTGNVSIRCYGMDGKAVSTLFQGVREPGVYSTSINANPARWPNGVYTLRSNINGKQHRQKLVFMQ